MLQLFSSILCFFWAASCSSNDDELPSAIDSWKDASTTKIVLDGLAQMHGEAEFDATFWNRIVSCMSDDDFNVSEAAWSGFIEFGISNGQVNDTWFHNVPVSWFEWDPKPLIIQDGLIEGYTNNISIGQPCNTVSNIAYYRSMIAICDRSEEWAFSDESVSALRTAFGLLAYESAFMHASETRLGRYLDDYLGISTLAYLMHQDVMSAFPYSPLLSELALDGPRKFTALTAITETKRVFQNENVYDWLEDMGPKFDIPTYLETFTALAMTTIVITLPTRIANNLEDALAGLLLPNSTVLDLMKGSFKPALVKEVEQFQASFIDKTRLFLSSVGMLLKMIWAFIWQEEVIPGSIRFRLKPLIRTGSIVTPLINRFGNRLTDFDRSDDSAHQFSFRVYPGDRQCNEKSAHSIWHEQSANAFVDLVFVIDNLKRMLVGQSLPRRGFNFDLLQDMFGDENGELLNLQNMDDDPIIDALGECLPHLLSIENISVGKFSECLATQMKIYQQQHTSRGLSRSSYEALDECLIDNECVSFNENGSLQVNHFQECMIERCSAFENSIAVNTCVKTKDCNGAICVLDCLNEQKGTLSPNVQQASACVVLLANPLRFDFRRILQRCTAGTTEKENFLSSQNGSSDQLLLQGLARITRCALVGPCRKTYLKFNMQRKQIHSCASQCQTDLSKDPFPFLPFPRNIACWIECTLVS